ncbi:MAG: LapA family protein [Lentimicrobiaceae bacterium]|nr:LapA family protein [Lentimicrobiaceae bacterium]MCB9023455.1 LapA family protein [Lentimicrobiaceae bacterium]MCO5265359.1 LapA family protein [Lentimicrobium sp.]HPG34396.1 LapA family protein [Lentimicrobium sp.]
MSRSAIITIIAAILLVIFSIQNSASAELKLFFWSFNMSLALMLLFIFLIGAGFGYFFHLWMVSRKQKSENTDKE